MKNNRYIDAMRGINPSENFVGDTLEKLKHMEKHKRIKRFTVSGVSLAALALAVVVTVNLILPGKTPHVDAAKNGVAVEMYDSGSYALVFEADEDSALGWPMAAMMGFNADMNTEEYSAVTESGFKQVSVSPLSTFAADVDTAVYSTVRRKLLDGELPDAEAIRTEEMLNYFSYKNLAPEDESDIAVNAYLGVCPWNEDSCLMFVGIGAKEIEEDNLPPANLVFLVDTSGSMDSSDKLDLIKRAFSLLTENLRPEDTVSIVTYAGSDRVEIEGVSGDNRGEIMEAVYSMTAWGSTNGSAGINTAYALAEKYFIPGGSNRVILMTDGDLNVGTTSEAALTELIEEKKESGVFLSVFGFGTGNYKDNKLETLADKGNGTYAYVDSITEARRALVTQIGAGFCTVAKDVKIQVEFNPAYVSEYRLIGYENRALAAEDFADDTKDGGEMGSGHTVVAVYEIIPAEGAEIAGVKGKKSENAVELKYSAAVANEIGEIAQVSVRYKAPDGDESRLLSKAVLPDSIATGEEAENLTLACAVTEFAMLLRDSEYKGTATAAGALELLKTLPYIDSDITELMYLITVADNLKAS